MEVAENENIYTDVKALMYFGKSYLKVPRVIIERMFASDNSERMIGIVHWLLFCFVQLCRRLCVDQKENKKFAIEENASSLRKVGPVNDGR